MTMKSQASSIMASSWGFGVQDGLPPAKIPPPLGVQDGLPPARIPPPLGVQDGLPPARIPPPPAFHPPHPLPRPPPPPPLPPNLSPVAEATFQMAAPIQYKNQCGALRAPSATEMPFPSFAVASPLPNPSYAWESHPGAPIATQPMDVRDVASHPKQKQAHGSDLPLPTRSLGSIKNTWHLTVKILNIPGSWSQDDVPEFAQCLGIEEELLRFAAVHRKRENGRYTSSTHAYLSFCSAKVVQRFKRAFTAAAAAGTIGALTLGTMNEEEHMKIETGYHKTNKKRPEDIPAIVVINI